MHSESATARRGWGVRVRSCWSPRINASKRIPRSSERRIREGERRREEEREEGGGERQGKDCVRVFELRNLKSFCGKL